MGCKGKTTKADRLASKRRDQEERKKIKLDHSREEKKRAREEEQIPIRERLTKLKLAIIDKKIELENEVAKIEKVVNENYDLSFAFNTSTRKLVILGDYTLSKLWADVRKEISVEDQNLLHLVARLNPREFLERFHYDPYEPMTKKLKKIRRMYPEANKSVIPFLAEITPSRGKVVEPHEIMTKNLKEIRKMYPDGTEFAIRMFEGPILTKDFLGPVSNYIGSLRCYHIKNDECLYCDCTRTFKGLILSERAQKLGDDLEFVVNDVIFQSQIIFIKVSRGMDPSSFIPNPYSPIITGMKIV